MGTHPIFESDFDCLTDKMSDSALSEIYSEGKNSVERLASLRNRISKVGKRALSPSSDVSESELKRLRSQLEKLKKISAETENDKDIEKIAEGALNKKEKLLQNLTNLEAALKFGKLFKEVESGLKPQKKSSDVKIAENYVNLTEKLKTVEGSKLENTAIFNSLSQKVKNLNPIQSLLKNWSENVRLG